MQNIQGKTLGETWLKLVKLVIENGEMIPDEKRDRLAVQCVRIKSETQLVPDKIISEYGNHNNVQQLLEMTFGNPEMHDFDVVPSFSDGAKSYFARLEESEFIDYAVERLTLIPESKKVIMVYPEWADYKKVRQNHKDDYLPCIVSVQLRMIENKDGSWTMNTIFFARSADAFQKFNANMIAMTMLTNKIAIGVSIGLNKKIKVGYLDGFCTDIHIYSETLNDAKKLIKKYEANKH